MEARRRGLPIYLFTTTGFKEYFNRSPLLKKKEFIFVPCLKIFDKVVYCLFFILQFLKNQLTIIQLRKRDSDLFDKLKLVFHKKFKYVVEKEGEIESEYDYLASHPYKENFYDKIISNKENAFKKNKREILRADHIICVTEKLKNYYISKYSINANKFTSLTTGCDSSKFRYYKKIRDKFRKELGLESEFVLIYIGNVYYSWQNISKTLEFYKKIKKINNNNIKLIIITRLVDKHIILDFLNKYRIKTSELILKYSIPNDEIPKYLNAADLGVILRENHPMNHFAAPGKFGEYACCGLPILTGKGIANFSEKLSKTPYGIVLENIYDNSEFLIKIKRFMENYVNLDRNKISNWGKQKFSFNAYINNYTNLYNRLLNE